MPASVNFQPLPDPEWNRAAATHLLWRAGLGGTTEEIDAVEALGPERAVAALLDQYGTDSSRGFLDAIPDTTEEEKALREVGWNSEADPKKRQAARQEYHQILHRQLRNLRDAWTVAVLRTKRPCLEKLTLFWHDYFAVSGEKVDYRAMGGHLALLRTRALGNFGDLLESVSRDPAMLLHLDNVNNRKGHPNENYARELMELFALGIGHYTEQDVLEAARAFTGWTFNRQTYEFEFREREHDGGDKTFLGSTGKWDGADIVRILLEQPACSRHLARKLLLGFVRHDPPPEQVEALAEVVRDERFELRPILRRLFRSRAFYDPQVRGRMVKSPVQLVLSSVRLMDMPEPPLPVLVETMRIMGQELLFPPDVNGWPYGARWINTSTLLMRYNFANYLTQGRMPAGEERWRPGNAAGAPDRFDPSRFLNLLRERRLSEPDQVTDFLIAHFIQRPIDSATRDRLVEYLQKDRAGGRARFDPDSKTAPEKMRGLIHIIMSSPEFQLC